MALFSIYRKKSHASLPFQNWKSKTENHEHLYPMRVGVSLLQNTDRILRIDQNVVWVNLIENFREESSFSIKVFAIQKKGVRETF